MRIRIPIAVTLAAAMAASSFGINAASAAPMVPVPAIHQAVVNDAPLIEVASRKRHRGNNAAAAAAFMGLVGGMMALAAQDSYRDRYYGYGRPYYGPDYYGRGYYGGRGHYYDYGPRGYYRHQHWHR